MSPRPAATVVGILSDTHGLIRPEALAALAGSNLIIHAGDVGRLEIISRLREIAPVFAVRGNIDSEDWAQELPLTQVVPAGTHQFLVLHRICELSIDPVQKGISAVIFGHSHKPVIEWRERVLYLNPGSAGPRRFQLPVCIARVHLSGKHIKPEIVRLDHGP